MLAHASSRPSPAEWFHDLCEVLDVFWRGDSAHPASPPLQRTIVNDQWTQTQEKKRFTALNTIQRYLELRCSATVHKRNRALQRWNDCVPVLLLSRCTDKQLRLLKATKSWSQSRTSLELVFFGNRSTFVATTMIGLPAIRLRIRARKLPDVSRMSTIRTQTALVVLITCIYDIIRCRHIF